MRIINFKEAGITIAPLCPCDFVGQNRIDACTFENNTRAGVRVLDSQPGQAGLTDHNVGNTISRNIISGSTIPIDLLGDGISCNDAGDGDVGPNNLLNFPSQFMVDSSDKTVTIKGANGNTTVPVEEKALAQVKDLKAGQKVTLICKDDAMGAHKAVAGVKAEAPKPAEQK